MTQFRILEHGIRNAQVIELLDSEGNLLGVLYPLEGGVRLVSKYLDPRQVKFDPVVPMALEIALP